MRSRLRSSGAFHSATAKLWIASIDDPKLEVQAQYNPQELQIDKQVPWQPHNSRDNRASGERDPSNPSEQADLEFNGAPTRSMSIELLFDGYESHISIEPRVALLEELSSVQDPESTDARLRRPHHCVVVWGGQLGGMRPFRCVIESLVTKYTMWDRAGRPLRATCTVRLKEAEQMGGPAAEPGSFHVRRGRHGNRR